MRRNRIRSVRDLSPLPSPVQNRPHCLPCEPHHGLSSPPLRPRAGTFAANYAQWTGGVTCDAPVVAPRPGRLEGSFFEGGAQSGLHSPAELGPTLGLRLVVR